MYNTILVPLDGSERAEAILPHIEIFAKPCDANVLLLRVEEPPVMLGRDEVMDMEKYHQEFENREREAEAYLSKKKDEYTQKGLHVETRMLFGSVVKTILEVARDVRADLIAMASHGIGGAYRMFYGSVTAGVIQQVDRPLLIIRTRRDPEK